MLTIPVICALLTATGLQFVCPVRKAEVCIVLPSECRNDGKESP